MLRLAKEKMSFLSEGFKIVTVLQGLEKNYVVKRMAVKIYIEI